MLLPKDSPLDALFGPDPDLPAIVNRALPPALLPGAALDFCLSHGFRAAASLLASARTAAHHAAYLRHANARATASSTPRPADVAAAWRIPSAPRTPAAALLLGEQLLAVSAPSAALHRIDPATHRCHLSSRGGGLKEWLRHAAPSIPYSTAMRYRRLASLLRRHLSLPPEIPLAWLLPSAPPPADLTPSHPLRRRVFSARRALARFLSEAPSLARIQRRLEADLGIAAARLGLAPLASYRDSRGLRPTPPPDLPPPLANHPALLRALRTLPPRPPRRRLRPPLRP